ncbi:MAG: GFA family protein, partial [Sphingomonadales bacterium]
MEGGCMCGAVRYRLASAPSGAGWCHCRTCQRNSGSPAMAFATMPVADFIFTQGEDLLGTIASSESGERRFCT